MGLDFVRSEVSEPLYDSVILFLAGKDAKSADAEADIWFRHKEVERIDGENSGDADGFTIRGTYRHFVMWRKDVSDLDAFAHELSHLAVAVFDDVGAPINRVNDETFAHYMGWLGKNCPMHQTILHS